MFLGVGFGWRPFCCSLRGMGDNFEVDVKGDLIVVWDPATHFYAIYAKPSDQPQLILKRRRPDQGPFNCSLDHGKRRTTVAI